MSSNEDLDEDNLPVGYKVNYPTRGSTFFQVILDNEEFYSEGEFLTLQILVLGVLMICPCIVCIVTTILVIKDGL